MRALLPGAALRASFSLFRRRPWATLALGTALLTSLAAVCCGLGVFTAPWFLCELFAMQIGLGVGESPRRTSAWLAAALVQMAAVVVLGAIASLTLLSLGPDVAFGGIALGTPTQTDQVAKGLGVLLGAGCLAIALSVHFEYAPAILLDRGGSLYAAVLESARLVQESGLLRTWLTSVVAHGIQMAPGLAAIALATERATLHGTLQWGVVLLPLVVLGLALGQGMVVASYLNVRELVTDPNAVPPEAAPSKSGALAWNILLLAVLAGPVLVSTTLVEPAQPEQARLPEELRESLELNVSDKPQELYVFDSALTISASRDALLVIASDGGGAGKLPLPGQIVHVRVGRPVRLPEVAQRTQASASQAFGIEATLADGRQFTCWVNEAGVRLDDSLARRLASRLSPWAPLALGLCLAWTALWIALALPPQAQLRRQMAAAPGAQREGRCDDLRLALRRRALRAALWLLPPATCSLAIGLWATFS